MRTMTVSLSPRQAQRVQEAVANGAYASNSEVVRDALRLWEQREEIRALELARLRQAFEEGLASGEPRAVDADQLLRRFKEKAGLGG